MNLDNFKSRISNERNIAKLQTEKDRIQRIESDGYAVQEMRSKVSIIKKRIYNLLGDDVNSK